MRFAPANESLLYHWSDGEIDTGTCPTSSDFYTRSSKWDAKLVRNGINLASGDEFGRVLEGSFITLQGWYIKVEVNNRTEPVIAGRRLCCFLNFPLLDSGRKQRIFLQLVRNTPRSEMNITKRGNVYGLLLEAVERSERTEGEPEEYFGTFKRVGIAACIDWTEEHGWVEDAEAGYF